MEIIKHRRKMLDAMERSAKETDNFAINVTSTGNVNGKSSSIKTKKQK